MASDHVDVLIVGAGLSGIGAACHLADDRPDKTYAVLEARDAIGGTWDLFRYPGIRSDSDMFTLGYSFRPWTDPKAIADGDDIRDYVRETAREYGVDGTSASTTGCSRADWTARPPAGRCTPSAPTPARRRAHLRVPVRLHRLLPLRRGVHAASRASTLTPGRWCTRSTGPTDLDYTGKRVVVIGSGATAVTLVPAHGRAGRARHDAPALTHVRDGAALARPARRRAAALAAGRRPRTRWCAGRTCCCTVTFQLSRRAPETVKPLLRRAAQAGCRPGTTSTRTSRPATTRGTSGSAWCPTATCSRAIRRGQGVGGHRHHRHLHRAAASGSPPATELPADIVVTATGLTCSPSAG